MTRTTCGTIFVLCAVLRCLAAVSKRNGVAFIVNEIFVQYSASVATTMRRQNVTMVSVLCAGYFSFASHSIYFVAHLKGSRMWPDSCDYIRRPPPRDVLGILEPRNRFALSQPANFSLATVTSPLPSRPFFSLNSSRITWLGIICHILICISCRIMSCVCTRARQLLALHVHRQRLLNCGVFGLTMALSQSISITASEFRYIQFCNKNFPSKHRTRWASSWRQ